MDDRKQQKKLANRSYYLRNRERILQQRKYKSTPVKRNDYIRVTFSLLLLASLIVLSTWYLIHEAVHAYTQDVGYTNGLLKASLGELFLLTFAFLRARTKSKGFYTLMLILGTSYSIWLVSGNVISHSLFKITEAKHTKATIQNLESELQHIENLYQKALYYDRITQASKTYSDLKSIRIQLSELRQTESGLTHIGSQLNTLLTLVAFRFFIVISSLVCVHRLYEIWTEFQSFRSY